jgi:acyl-CoA thioesterase
MLDFELIKKYRSDFNGFSKYTGIEITDMAEGYARGELSIIQEKHGNTIGSVQGGVIFTLADAVGGTAALSRGSSVTTVDANINYLRAALNVKKLIAEAKERKAGKNILVYDVEVTDETGRLIAIARLSFCSLHKEPTY